MAKNEYDQHRNECRSCNPDELCDVGAHLFLCHSTNEHPRCEDGCDVPANPGRLAYYRGFRCDRIRCGKIHHEDCPLFLGEGVE